MGESIKKILSRTSNYILTMNLLVCVLYKLSNNNHIVQQKISLSSGIRQEAMITKIY